MLRMKNVSQGYGIVAFQEVAKGKCKLGLWCPGFLKMLRKKNFSQDFVIFPFFQKSRERNVTWGCGVVSFQKPRERNVRQGFVVMDFPAATKEKCQLGLRFLFFPRSREMKITSQGYGILAFPKVAKEKCQLALRCLCFRRSHEREMLVRIQYDVFAFLKSAKEKYLLGI